MHDLATYAFELPAIEEWLAGDDRQLVFQVTDSDETPVNISGATVSWALFERPYQADPADAVLTDDDATVETVTDERTDTNAGLWEVRLDGDATTDLWGAYWQRPVVEQPDGSEATWRGKVVVTA